MDVKVRVLLKYSDTDSSQGQPVYILSIWFYLSQKKIKNPHSYQLNKTVSPTVSEIPQREKCCHL